MQRPVHLSFGQVKTIVDGKNMGGGRLKTGGKKRSSKTIDIVSYASKVSVNVSHVCLKCILWSSDTFKVYKLA